MSRWHVLGLVGLLAYSTAIFFAEGIGGQPQARWYLTDIDAQGPFYGVNTSVCSWLLAGSGLVFLLSVFVSRLQASGGQRKAFFVLQAVLFFYLALDERFLLHEHLGGWLRVGDAYILLALGLAEVIVLVKWRSLLTTAPRARRWLWPAAGFFALMVLVDALLPSDLHFRLSVEDLSKTWATVCMFCFALECYSAQIEAAAERVVADSTTGEGQK